eukprot:scaffold222774_cov53-Attheya_sp.AAC.1
MDPNGNGSTASYSYNYKHSPNHGNDETNPPHYPHNLDLGQQGLCRQARTVRTGPLSLVSAFTLVDSRLN